jgi:hypothetical protein
MIAEVRKAIAGYTSLRAAAISLGVSRSVLQAIMAGSHVREGSLALVREKLKARA